MALPDRGDLEVDAVENHEPVFEREERLLDAPQGEIRLASVWTPVVHDGAARLEEDEETPGRRVGRGARAAGR